ncbi:MAG: LacI family transcriptional regulator [Lachnospiraceae bacterium]|nr:LacI family transcriptional regulator [Lachnospiraceae bacterium]
MSEINIKDIAKICGVGVSTVSRAINNHPDVNPETKEKILKVIRENHYVPNNSARNLKRSDSNTIAVLVKGVSNTFFTEMIETIQNEIKKHNYSMVLHRVEFDEDEVDVALELVKEKRLRGIIFLGGYFVHSEEKLKRLKVPFVLSTAGSISKVYNRDDYSSVSVDDMEESRKMTQYLIDLGHRKIALIATRESDVSVGKLRIDGYRKALNDNNIKIEKSLILHMDPNIEEFSSESGYKAMKDFLDEGKKCTAVFAISDTVAFGAIRAIYDSGLTVPGDISVAGFDGIKAGEFYIPSLTTIKQPIDEISRATSDILFEIINGSSGHRHEIYPGSFIERESTDRLSSSK